MKSLDAVVVIVAGFVVVVIVAGFVVIAAILLLLLSFCVNHFYNDLIKYTRKLLQIVLTLPSILFLSYW